MVQILCWWIKSLFLFTLSSRDRISFFQSIDGLASMVLRMVSIPRIWWIRAGFSPVVKNSMRVVLSVILL